MPRFSAPIVIIAIVLGATLMGCSANALVAGAPGSTAAASKAAGATSAQPRRPTFDLAIDGGPAAGRFASDSAASLNVCSRASDGSWRWMFAGGAPWVSIDLLVGAQAAEPAHAADVALEITAGSGYLWIDQGGFRGGDAPGRSQVAVAVRAASAGTTFAVTATTPNRTTGGDGAPSTVTMTVTCPT